MAHLTRRSVLRGSAALAGARVLGFPHVAKAAATTASVWFAQGFVQDEDVSLRKAVADYEKASGNKIELSITPFAPERQKIIAALTSGVVPDVMANNPNEILQIYAWQDRWVDVSDVVETQKAQFSETALVSGQAYNNVTKKVSQYGVPVAGRGRPLPYLATAGGESRPQDRGHPEDVGRVFRLLQEGAGQPAQAGRAQGVRPGLPGDGQRGRPLQPLHGVSPGPRRSGYRHQGRQAASRRPEGQAGGHQVGGLPRRRLPGRLRAAERDQLERRGRQQRLPREAHGDGRRRDALDRGRRQGEAPGVVLQGHGDPRSSAIRTTMRASPCRASWASPSG